jgi:hypothetical protein
MFHMNKRNSSLSFNQRLIIGLLSLVAACNGSAQVLEQNSIDQATAGEVEEKVEKAKNTKPAEAAKQNNEVKEQNPLDGGGLLMPNDQNPQGQKPAPDGIIPLVTPFDAVKPMPGQGSPLDFNQPPSVDGAVIPLIEADPSLVDPFATEESAETAAEDGTEVTEETLPESEQEQIINAFAEDSFFGQSQNTFLPTLAPTPMFGTGDASLSEMAGVISPTVPVDSYSAAGLSFQTYLKAYYDSNPGRIPETIAHDGDFVTTAALVAAYRPVVVGRWNIEANVVYGYNKFTDYEVLDSDFATISGSVGYRGARTSARFSYGYQSATGANRDVGASLIVQQINVNMNQGIRYRLSPRTSLDAGLSYNLAELSGAVADKRDNFAGRISGVWTFSPLLEIGAGIRLSEQETNLGFTRSSYGPTVLANYRISRLFTLRSDMSIEYATLNDNEKQTGVDATLGMSYNPSALWGLSLDYRRSNQPLLANNSSFQVLDGIRLGVRRNLIRTSLNLGVAYEQSAIENTTGTTSFGNEFMSIDGSISRVLYKDVVHGSVYFRYADQTGAFQTWDSKQLGFSITYLF